jgi:hypothetical protein
MEFNSMNSFQEKNVEKESYFKPYKERSKPTKSGTHFEGAVKIVLQDILINKTFRKNIRGPEHIFLVKAFDHYV